MTQDPSKTSGAQGDGAQGDGDNKPEAAKPETARGRGGRQPRHKVGDVIKTGDGAYALVVGFEDRSHNVLQNDGSTKTEKHSHPLVVDLPAARRHETETEAA